MSMYTYKKHNLEFSVRSQTFGNFFHWQVEEFLGPHPDYDEEEEERKYYRRKRLGVVKNVVGASCGGMIVYSVYMGQPLRITHHRHIT